MRFKGKEMTSLSLILFVLLIAGMVFPLTAAVTGA